MHVATAGKVAAMKVGGQQRRSTTGSSNRWRQGRNEFGGEKLTWTKLTYRTNPSQR